MGIEFIASGEAIGVIARNKRGRKVADKIGGRYGRLVVVDKSENDSKGNVFWLCLCDCGHRVPVRSKSLGRPGGRIDCGCGLGGRRRGIRIVSPGQRYERWLVVERNMNDHRYRGIFWWCLCDCGRKVSVRGSALLFGSTTGCGCGLRLPPGEAAFNRLYYRYRENAIKRELSWNLTQEDFRAITKQACHYCGVSASQVIGGRKKSGKHSSGTYSNGSYTYNGVDRRDSSVGYEIGNVVPCCGDCNYTKTDSRYNDFAVRVKVIYNHWAKYLPEFGVVSGITVGS